MIVAGIGCRRGCAAADVVAAVRMAEAVAGCEVALLAAPDFKRAEPGLHEAAAALGLPLRFVERSRLEAVQPDCPTRSGMALAAVGLASVAEAAALAFGPLILPRIVRGGATCALARA